MNIAHEIDSMQLLSWLEWMWDERALFWLQKKVNKGRRFRCVPSLWRWFQNFSRWFRWKEQVHFDLKGLELTKFAKETFWKYNLVLNWIHKLEIFLWTKNSLFLFALNATINVFPQRGEGGHTGAIDIDVLPVSGASEQLLTQRSPQGAGVLTFLVQKDWERVIVHTREELARGPSERGIEWYLRAFARMRAVRLFFASASSDQFSHANSEHFVNFHHLESLFIETLFCAK